jgi:hypothetical protein
VRGLGADDRDPHRVEDVGRQRPHRRGVRRRVPAAPHTPSIRCRSGNSCDAAPSLSDGRFLIPPFPPGEVVRAQKGIRSNACAVLVCGGNFGVAVQSVFRFETSHPSIRRSARQSVDRWVQTRRLSVLN